MKHEFSTQILEKSLKDFLKVVSEVGQTEGAMDIANRISHF
jgi:hypothetical protein